MIFLPNKISTHNLFCYTLNDGKMPELWAGIFIPYS